MGRREEGERRNRKGNKLREPFRARFILVRLGGVHNAPCSAFSCEARPLWAHETKKEHIYYAGWVAAATPPLGLIRSVSLYNATPTTTPLRVFLPFSLSLSLSLPLSLSLRLSFASVLNANRAHCRCTLAPLYVRCECDSMHPRAPWN